MKYHILNDKEPTASFKYKANRDSLFNYWLKTYGEAGLTKKDDTFAKFAEECPSKCFGGCMKDDNHRDCREGICKTWSRE